MTRRPSRRGSAAWVSSDDPLSTTMVSRRTPTECCAMAMRQRKFDSQPSRTGTTIETDGRGTGCLMGCHLSRTPEGAQQGA
jgi:hypothetical protein